MVYYGAGLAWGCWLFGLCYGCRGLSRLLLLSWGLLVAGANQYPCCYEAGEGC